MCRETEQKQHFYKRISWFIAFPAYKWTEKHVVLPRLGFPTTTYNLINIYERSTSPTDRA